MPRYPNKVMEFIKRIPEGHSGLKKLIKKNYQRIDLEKLNDLNFTDEETQMQSFYIQIIEQVFLTNPEALELLQNLSVLNDELESNINRKYVESSYKLQDIEQSFNELLNTGILKKKVDKKELYEFSDQSIKDAFEIISDEECHENAIRYYEKKKKRYKEDLNEEIEILFHRANLNPTKELVDQFLSIINRIDEFDYRTIRLINIAELLMILEDRYKAPILIALGNIFSVIGKAEDAEKIYLNALDIYKKLAKQYYKIYLPYIASIQKNLGTLYTDSKRFEEAEKLYSDALSSYKEIEKQYYNVYSPEPDVKEDIDLEKSYMDDLKTYNEILKKYYDIYLPTEPSTKKDLGNVCIDLDLLEDIQDGTIDSLDNYKKLARMCYDMYLVDIAKTQSNLGIIYTELMNFEDAEKMHLEALNIKKSVAEKFPDQVLPEVVLTLLDLGDLYASFNKFEDAEQRFKEALSISKKLAEQNPEIYMHNVAIIQNSLGTIYSKLKKLAQAEQIYLDSLKIFKVLAKEDPNTYTYNVAEVQGNLGNLYMLLKNHEKAKTFLNKAIKNDPTNGNIIFYMACFESLQNNQSMALELLNNVIELDERYIEWAKSDERLDNIRNLKEFKELIGE
ncbi:MAG: tetratricopeptide repeat protein [Candidatus Hermodarchaeota archaeon]